MGTVDDLDPVRCWAQSGVAALTGRADGPPLIPPGRAAALARTYGGWIADVTGGAVDLDGACILAERAAFTGRGRNGATSVGGACRLLPTVDGWAVVSCARPDDPVLLGVAAGPVAVAVPVSEPPLPVAPRPVTGMLVVDFSALWAVPLCAHLLGLAGARVVKVETPSRPDGARCGNREFYRVLHGGHESVVLDPTDTDQRRALGVLVGAADIVIEASRPRALAGFGLDAAAFVAGGGTWISITAHGREANRIGFGDDIAAGAGLVARDAIGPVFVGDAIADPLTGLAAAALAMSAPEGAGKLWHISMSALVASTLDGSETIVAESTAAEAGVAEPRPRTQHGEAAESGRDTAAVLAELGVSI